MQGLATEGVLQPNVDKVGSPCYVNHVLHNAKLINNAMHKPAKGLKEAKGITYDDEASCSAALLTAKRALEALRAKKANLAAKLVVHKAKAQPLSAEGSRDLKAGAPKAKRTAELCCGCARYSFHLQLAGAKIMPIDKLLILMKLMFQ